MPAMADLFLYDDRLWLGHNNLALRRRRLCRGSFRDRCALLASPILDVILRFLKTRSHVPRNRTTRVFHSDRWRRSLHEGNHRNAQHVVIRVFRFGALPHIRSDPPNQPIAQQNP